MRLLIGVSLVGLLLAAAGQPAGHGQYHASVGDGRHSWEQSVWLHGHRFTSKEWRTNFFDVNTQTLTGTIRQEGDTLHLVAQAISFYSRGAFVKGKGWKYYKHHCGCQALLADTARLPDYRLTNERRVNQALCRRGYVLLLTGDSLTEIERQVKGSWWKGRGFHKVNE